MFILVDLVHYGQQHIFDRYHTYFSINQQLCILFLKRCLCFIHSTGKVWLIISVVAKNMIYYCFTRGEYLLLSQGEESHNHLLKFHGGGGKSYIIIY